LKPEALSFLPPCMSLPFYLSLILMSMNTLVRIFSTSGTRLSFWHF
jgi:hypothetical protein